MVAAVFLTVGVIWLICALAYGERVQRPREIRVDDTVKLQSRAHVFATGWVLRLWPEGATMYAEVVDERGERYIRPVELLERIINVERI